MSKLPNAAAAGARGWRHLVNGNEMRIAGSTMATRCCSW